MNIHNQRGATLIVVMALLLLIIVISITAVRQSTTALNIATNAQAQQLMFESSDAALAYVENISAQPQFNHSDGIIGSLRDSSVSVETQNIFCYRAQTNNPIANYSQIVWQNDVLNNTLKGIEGYCLADQFSDSKRAVVTQVNIKKSMVQSNSLAGYAIGTSIDEKNGATPPLQITTYTTSFIPSLSSASQNDINLCLRHVPVLPNPVDIGIRELPANTQTIGQCLSRLNVPYYVSVAEYQVANTFKKQDTK